MIGVTFSGRTYAALADTLPPVSVEHEISPDRDYRVWLPRREVMTARPARTGETFSEVIPWRADRSIRAIDEVPNCLSGSRAPSVARSARRLAAVITEGSSAISLDEE